MSDSVSLGGFEAIATLRSLVHVLCSDTVLSCSQSDTGCHMCCGVAPFATFIRCLDHAMPFAETWHQKEEALPSNGSFVCLPQMVLCALSLPCLGVEGGASEAYSGCYGCYENERAEVRIVLKGSAGRFQPQENLNPSEPTTQRLNPLRFFEPTDVVGSPEVEDHTLRPRLPWKPGNPEMIHVRSHRLGSGKNLRLDLLGFCCAFAQLCGARCLHLSSCPRHGISASAFYELRGTLQRRVAMKQR